jgi:small-conductance mechanosensitive channel
MKITQPSRILALLLCMLIAVNSAAQENADSSASVQPDLSSLQNNWWANFEGPREDVEPRVASFLDAVGKQIAGLTPQNQQTAESVLAAVRDNFNAYLALLDDPELTLQRLEPAAVDYSIDELLGLASQARDARAGSAEVRIEVEREQRILDGTSRRRDAAFKNYVNAKSGDERWLLALRMVLSRTAQAISARRLELLKQRHERATAYATATAERVALAADQLETEAGEKVLDELTERVATRENNVENAAENLRAAQLAASGLDVDTAQGRSQQRLEQTRLQVAEIKLALAETLLAQANAKRWWTELKLDQVPDTSVLAIEAIDWLEFVRSTELSAPEWKRDTQDGLLAIQSINRDGLDRASRRLLDQRLGTAQESLTKVGELETAVADLRLLMLAVDNAAAEHTGIIRSWLTSIIRGVKTMYLRITGLADVTLFSLGDAPVTGGDILRVLVILIVAMLLSRLIRHAIRRVGRSDSSGTQASLYTVSRLTHYIIIVFAIFIALSSIGLNFGNLALVAGALSVGIGFGLQSIVNNFVSGLIILFEHSLRVGDYIELDTGLTGTVKAINVRSTLINTNDNIDIVVPNSEFVTTRLTNWTLGERTLRVRIPFGVAYGSDKELVKKAALEAAEEVPYTLSNTKTRETNVRLVDFGDNSLDFLLLVWVNRQGARRPTKTKSAYLWELESKLTEYGIQIPFPQRDLHLRSGWPKK